MSKRFEQTFPKLAQAIQDNKVLQITDDDGQGIYIGYNKDGIEYTIGLVGYERQIENLLESVGI